MIINKPAGKSIVLKVLLETRNNITNAYIVHKMAANNTHKTLVK